MASSSDHAGSSSRGSSQLQVQGLTTTIIPKVREQLRRAAGESLFAPQAVVIGPYHRSSQQGSFPWTEEMKREDVRWLENLRGYRPAGLKRLVDDLVPQVMQCYNTNMLDPGMNSEEEFSEMLLHDGCYLLCYFTNLIDDDRPRRSNDNTIVRDILYLLENQIPLSVLDRMWRLLGVKKTALECVAKPVRQLLLQQLYIGDSTYPVTSDSTPSDLLHVVHSYFRRPPAGAARQSTSLTGRGRCWAMEYLHLVYSWSLQRLPQRWRRWCRSTQFWRHLRQGPDLPTEAPQRSPTATGWWRQQAIDYLHPVCCCFIRRLRQEVLPTGRWRGATYYSRHANLRFRRRSFGANVRTILDIDLQGGTLDIPFLRVGSSTWTMLRNLMALEEQEEERPITAYCYFMSQVAGTTKDIELLQRANVLEHFMGSDEQAAKGFAHLCDGVALDVDNDKRNYLKPFWQPLEKRCRDPVHNFLGFFRNMHCSNVFYGVAFFFAVIVFACEVTQAIYAVIGYHKPR